MDENNINDEKQDYNVSKFFVIGLVIVLLLVIFVIPTISVLSIVVSIPPDHNTVNVIPSRITIYQDYTRNIKKMSYGNTEVYIKLFKSSSGKNLYKSSNVSQGTWIINTFLPVSKGDIVNIEIQDYNFTKMIPIV